MNVCDFIKRSYPVYAQQASSEIEAEGENVIWCVLITNIFLNLKNSKRLSNDQRPNTISLYLGCIELSTSI